VTYEGVCITNPNNRSNPQQGDPCHSLTTDTRNYVCLPSVVNSSGNDIAGTLDASYYKGSGARSGMEREFVALPIAYGITAWNSNSMKSGNPHSGIWEAEASRCLDGHGAEPTSNQAGMCVCEPVAFTEKRFFEYHDDDTSVTLRARGGSYGGGYEALRAAPSEPVVIEMTSTKNTIVEDGIVPTLTARMGTGGNQVNAVLQKILDSITWIVRRLTPLECTRLQGFPDGWLDIGDWYDSKGRLHRENDTVKYKAIGNSIALPYWAEMFERMAKHLPPDATLGSLFDGIGGFPLLWEHIHGKGTARWASEIEDYPIAVTKYHFGED